jgi:hypothetical protein
VKKVDEVDEYNAWKKKIFKIASIEDELEVC